MEFNPYRTPIFSLWTCDGLFNVVVFSTNRVNRPTEVIILVFPLDSIGRSLAFCKCCIACTVLPLVYLLQSMHWMIGIPVVGLCRDPFCKMSRKATEKNQQVDQWMTKVGQFHLPVSWLLQEETTTSRASPTTINKRTFELLLTHWISLAQHMKTRRYLHEPKVP